MFSSMMQLAILSVPDLYTIQEDHMIFSLVLSDFDWLQSAHNAKILLQLIFVMTKRLFHLDHNTVSFVCIISNL